MSGGLYTFTHLTVFTQAKVAQCANVKYRITHLLSTAISLFRVLLFPWSGLNSANSPGDKTQTN